MIIMKKIIYLVLLCLITSLAVQAQEKKSEWNGCDRYDFTFKDRQATVVVPKKAAKGNPWIWRPAFFDAFPSVDKALLEKGFHIVYYDVTHLYGSPRAVSLGTEFYKDITDRYGLSPKVTLEGFSRGGLFAFNWAAQNTDKVACIYVDAPVCNVFSWPGRKNATLWNDLLKEWNLTDAEMEHFKGNPIDNLAPIAAAGIPIISVCGDSDQTVPYKENMDVVRSRYLAAGGPVEVILKKGCDHHPHSLENPEPVVDFILRQQPEYEKYLHYTLRGSLQNSFRKFEKERRARVAFLGGSITEMNGWRNMVEQQLQQRFPYTQFEWVEAGIGSTGTTPGSFRLQHDILSKGKIDLLFVEAAVNDDTNGFSALEQVRGMEGEVRHALESNPEMDIVMLHFIYDPFIPLIARRQMPDVILNHERVANHYLIPSVNLCQEIGERMQDGEFTWDDFGGTHPKPFGHKFYAAAIGHLFDEMWKGVSPEGPIVAHEIPVKPLDTYSYYNGDFIALEKARLNKGWKLVGNWHPDNKAEKRNGFVDVPMLEATRPGDRLTLDFRGKAIGIFCVSGPSAGILEYSVDGAPFKELDTFTQWSHNLYIPWVYMLETELEDTDHKLVLRISKKKNPASLGTECQIRNFVVNGK
ncbi:SGNH/GDSL hydrolase family protein [Parabacteroides massiliensis]|uniref:SGNH/GDSL hydrolase family protein n=1 Tax=Parabacteroides massiliensis TaxID=1750560 RepID=UPI00096AA05A|nr:SGNH/GDSL hydrolase family protein [Parabacteroides massiliensis]